MIDCSRNEYAMTKITLKSPSEMPEDEVQLETLKFDMIDRDKTKEIDWWEFLHYETIKMLRRRRRRSLTKVLTPNEIHQVMRFIWEYERWNVQFISKEKTMGKLKE